MEEEGIVCDVFPGRPRWESGLSSAAGFAFAIWRFGGLKTGEGLVSTSESAGAGLAGTCHVEIGDRAFGCMHRIGELGRLK